MMTRGKKGTPRRPCLGVSAPVYDAIVCRASAPGAARVNTSPPPISMPPTWWSLPARNGL
jgi:hypothetical protein